MRSKMTFLVLLIAAQMAHALDSVPQAEYRQRRVKLAALLHGGSALIVAAHEPSMEYQDYRQDEDFFYLTGSNEPGGALLLIGETKGHLGQSIYLREIEGKEIGAAPPVVEVPDPVAAS